MRVPIQLLSLTHLRFKPSLRARKLQARTLTDLLLETFLLANNRMLPIMVISNE